MAKQKTRWTPAIETMLRLWCDGPDVQAQVWNDFATAPGRKDGRAALASLEMLLDLCMRHGRRPLLRHHIACTCLWADETCCANFVGYASGGQREDALLIATSLVHPDMALSLVDFALNFGLALRRIALKL